MTRIKQERVEIDKPNDISVYDFEEGNFLYSKFTEIGSTSYNCFMFRLFTANPPISGNIEGEDAEELCANEAEEMIPIETSGGDIKPLLGMSD